MWKLALLILILCSNYALAGPIINDTTGEFSNTNLVTIKGSNFGPSPNTAETAFSGGNNGWAAQTPSGTRLKDMIPFSTAENSEWNYVYPSFGTEDTVTNEEQRVRGKNNFRTRTGSLTPSGTFTSSFGLDHAEPQATFFISFWVNQQVQQIIEGVCHSCPDPESGWEGRISPIQNKFFSISPHADPGEPGVVDSNFYGSNRNQVVIGGRFSNVDGSWVRNGFSNEWYTHHTKPGLPETHNICGINRDIGPNGLPYLNAIFVDGPGGHNGQSCNPYDWTLYAAGSSNSNQYALMLDEWNKIQIWMKAGDFDSYDDRYIFQILRPDGVHINSVDIKNGNFFTQLWGDNGEFTYPRRFWFYQYFGQSCGAGCQGATDGEIFTYVDDFYIQPGSWAHVEIGDAPVYEDTNILEIQQPINWTNDSIDLILNTGFFNPGDTAYLFVIDEDGTPSPGYNITIETYTQGDTCWDFQQNQDEEGIDCGGICPEPCPSCDDHIQNQGEEGVDCGAVCGISCPQAGDIITLQNGFNGYTGQTDICIYSKDGEKDKTFPDCPIRDHPWGYRMLTHFDMSPVETERTIRSAELTLVDYATGSRSTTMDISQVIKPWNISGATWRCTNDVTNDGCTAGEIPWELEGAKGTSDAALLLNTPVNTTSTMILDVTNIVKQWYVGAAPNFGFLLSEVGNNDYIILAPDTHPEPDEEIRPKLVITFEPEQVDNSCTFGGYDFTGECGIIDFDDFMIVVQHFRTTDSVYDFNNDNQVNVLDLVLHLLTWS